MKHLLTQRELVIFLAFLTPLLFSFFFARQAYFVFAYDFSVWKGGGMGMFSSPDHPSKRQLFFFVVDEDGTKKQVIPTNSSRFGQYYNFAILPHPETLSDMQADFFGAPLYVSRETPSAIWVSDYPEFQGQRTLDPQHFKVELWKMHHIDSEANTLHTNVDTTWDLYR